MAEFTSPCIAAFASFIQEEAVMGQVLIRKEGAGYELRHATDGKAEAGSLRTLLMGGAELREVARFDGEGKYRPLKSAPDLRAGWRVAVGSPRELEGALNQLYPGGLADWFYCHRGYGNHARFEEFASRQTGRYGGVRRLGEEGIARVVRACCRAELCLKQRRWEGGGRAADGVEGKGMIPCLEPCALFLDLARRAVEMGEEGEIVS